MARGRTLFAAMDGHLPEAFLADVDEQALAACRHDAIGPDLAAEHVLAPADLDDAADQLEFGVQRRGAMEARRQCAGDAGLAGDFLCHAEKVVEDRAEIGRAHV